MPHQTTVPVRIYDSDKDYLTNNRGNGTPADALKKLIVKYEFIVDVIEGGLS